MLIEFTDKLKNLAVKSQNIYRDKIARGEVKVYKKAARMATLVSILILFGWIRNVSYQFFFFLTFALILKVWNDELAKLAEYNVRRCIFGHDECRNTGKLYDKTFSFI